MADDTEFGIQDDHCHGDRSQNSTNADGWTHGGNTTLSNGDEKFMMDSAVQALRVVVADLKDNAKLATERVPLTFQTAVTQEAQGGQDGF